MGHHSGVSASPVAPRSARSRRRLLGGLLALLLAGGLVAAILLTRRGIDALNRVPNSPDEFTRHEGWMTKVMFALLAFIGAGAALDWNRAWPPLRWAHRCAVRLLIAGFVCFWLPVPFGITQYLTVIALYAGAGPYVWVVVRAIADELRGRPRFGLGVWALAASAAFVAAGLLLDKAKTLGWAFAND